MEEATTTAGLRGVPPVRLGMALIIVLIGLCIAVTGFRDGQHGDDRDGHGRRGLWLDRGERTGEGRRPMAPA
jgi:hypothetical protein